MDQQWGASLKDLGTVADKIAGRDSGQLEGREIEQVASLLSGDFSLSGYQLGPPLNDDDGGVVLPKAAMEFHLTDELAEDSEISTPAGQENMLTSSDVPQDTGECVAVVADDVAVGQETELGKATKVDTLAVEQQKPDPGIVCADDSVAVGLRDSELGQAAGNDS